MSRMRAAGWSLSLALAVGGLAARAESVTVVRLPDFTVTSAAFIDAPGTTVTFPAGARGLLLMQGVVRSSATSGVAELELYEPASGFVYARAGAAGTNLGARRTWFFFDFLDGVTARQLRVRLRHSSGALATAERVEVALLQLPPATAATAGRAEPVGLSPDAGLGTVLDVNLPTSAVTTLVLAGAQLRVPSAAVNAWAQSVDSLTAESPSPRPGADPRTFLHTSPGWDSMVGAGTVAAPSAHTTSVVVAHNRSALGLISSPVQVEFASARVVALDVPTLSLRQSGSPALFTATGGGGSSTPATSLLIGALGPGRRVFTFFGGYADTPGTVSGASLLLDGVPVWQATNFVPSGERQLVAAFALIDAPPGDFRLELDVVAGMNDVSMWAPLLVSIGPLDGGMQVLLPDGGDADAGTVDAGALDAGQADAGASPDAGSTSDAGSVDGGLVDAGPGGDAGVTDAGHTSVDAGAEDAGVGPPRELQVGCGCDGAGASLWWVVVLLFRRGGGKRSSFE